MKPIKIETDRLILRTPKFPDIIPLNKALNKSLSQIQRWESWANDASENATEKFIREGIRQWNSPNQNNFPVIITNKADQKIIGASGYNEQSDSSIPFYEIGYWIQSDYTGKGLATELTNTLTEYAFKELNAARVQIKMQTENIASKKVAQKCGYKLEATLKSVILDNISKKPADSHVFVKFFA